MATLTTVRTALEAKLVANLSVDAIVTRAISRDEKITAGQTEAGVIPLVAGYLASDSNVLYVLGNYVIRIAHHLTSSLDEDTYLDGDYATDQAALMLPSFFRSLSGVHELTSNPVPTAVERDGNIIEYTVTVEVAISP